MGGRFKTTSRTVQGELTSALSLIDGRSVNVHGSGRTDAGVHAEGQVASVEIQREISTEKLRAAINANVGRDVRVLTVETAADDFHARYSALEKTYIYRIVNGPGDIAFLVALRSSRCAPARSGEHEARRGIVPGQARLDRIFSSTVRR